MALSAEAKLRRFTAGAILIHSPCFRGTIFLQRRCNRFCSNCPIFDRKSGDPGKFSRVVRHERAVLRHRGRRDQKVVCSNDLPLRFELRADKTVAFRCSPGERRHIKWMPDLPIQLDRLHLGGALSRTACDFGPDHCWYDDRHRGDLLKMWKDGRIFPVQRINDDVRVEEILHSDTSSGGTSSGSSSKPRSAP